MLTFISALHGSVEFDEVDLWLVAGQSNTDGRVPISEPPSWLDGTNTAPYSLMFNDILNAFKSWEYGVNSGADDNQSLLWAYDSTAIYQYGQLNSRPQYVVKNTRGGTSIGLNPIVGVGCWNVDFESITNRKLLQELEDKFNLAKAALADKGKVPIVKGLLWHQGESDSTTAQNQNDYYNNFKDVIAYVRGFVGNANLPVVFGSISHLSGQYSSIIESAHFQVASEDDNAYIVDMSSGTLLDAYHFDASSSEHLGNQMYSIMMTL